MVLDVIFAWAMVLLPEGGGVFDTGLRYPSFVDCQTAITAADSQIAEGTPDRAALQRMVCMPAAGATE